MTKPTYDYLLELVEFLRGHGHLLAADELEAIVESEYALVA